jgi:adenylate cyclase class 2
MLERLVLEVEVKLPCADLDAVRRRLGELGAEPLGVQEQEDTFFAHPQRDFAATDEALRLRRVGARLELTYKGPKQPGPAKARSEYTIAPESDPTAMLTSLGFRVAHTLRKRRDAHRLGSVEVALDTVQGVGTYVEVEALGDDADAARAQVADAVARLGLDRLPEETRSYLELFLDAAGRPTA